MDIRNLQFLFQPSYWLMNNRYNKDVDTIINELLDKYEFSNMGCLGLTCDLGEVTVWTGNRPYASMGLYMGSELDNYRPSRLTIKRGLKKFYKYRKEEFKILKNEELAKIRSLMK